MDNLFNRFLSVAASARQEPAVIVQEKDTVETWTYGDLLDQGTSVAAWLELSGINRGQRCAILSENQPLWCAAYLGVLHGGAVAVPLDVNQGADSLKLFLRDCDAQVLFTSARELEKARKAVGRLPMKVVLLDGEISDTSDVIPLPNQPTGIEAPQPSVVDLHDVALLLYTSGTSGSPKGVLLTHGNMLAVLDGLVDVIPVSRRDRGLAILPLFHILAQLTTLLVPLSVGGAVVMLNDLNATEVLRALQERNVTVFCCVPQFFYLIHQRIMQHVSANWFRRQLFRLMLSSNALLRRTVSINLGRLLFRQVHSLLGPKMRFLITGGSRFDPAVAKDLYNLGFDILQGYGLTECAGNATLTRPGNRQFDSVGYPVGKTQIKIVPSTLFSNGEGEIAIRGPNVMLGYHNREDLTAEVIDDGWLLTGDLGRIDNRGQLSITGRKKEVIVLSSGKNIYPEELEAHYQRSPFLKEICIVPRSAQSGIASVVHLHAVVVPDMDLMQQQQITDIQDKVRSEIDDRSALLPSYERVNSFQLSRTVLPRTSTGKPKRHEIEQLATKPPMKATKSWSDEQLRWAAQPDVRKALEIIRKQTSHAEVHPAYRFDLDLDQDSLGRVELIIQVAEAFDTVVPDGVTPSIHTVRDLIDAVLKETNVSEERAAKMPRMTDQPWHQLLSPEATSGLAQKYLAAPSTLRYLWLFAASRFVFLIAKVLLRMKVDGRQNLTEGPMLVCPNHQTYFDGLLIASAVPWRVFRRLYFVGASMYFSRGWLRWLARRANIVLLDTESNVIESMRVCASGLREGKAFLIFPEGERTIDGTLGSLRKGTAILSTHTEAPIIPAGISGAFEIWPRGKGLQRMNQVRIRFGSSLPPFPLPENITGIEGDRIYQTQTDLLANRIESLIK